MATYQVSGPGGAVYQIDGPDGADPAAIVGTLTGQASPKSSAAPAGGVLRDVALAGRDVGEGVLNTLAAPHDISVGITNLARRGLNRMLGTQLPQVPTFSSRLSSALTTAGAPVPTTSDEKLAAAGIQGTAGALTGAGLLGLVSDALGPGVNALRTSLPTALRAGAAGATGGSSAQLAREAGAGPVGQFAAGLAGGLAPTGLEGAVSVSRALARPFTRAGQAQLAANTLSREATNPAAAAVSLDNAAPLVPGSARTTGEASGDTGMLALEKGVRARNPGQFGERISQQNAARQAELEKLAGTQADITAAENAREATTTPMREAALGSGGTANVRPVLLKIDRMLASPAGKRDVPNAALTWLRDKLSAPDDVSSRFMTPSRLAQMGRGTFEARNPESLYAIRQDVNDAMNGRLGGDLSKFKLARSQLLAVRDTLDDAIEQAAPGFKAYLAKYRDMSAPIDQMGGMQDLQQRASSGLDTASGYPFLSAPKFSTGLRNLESGNTRLTPDQTARLGALREDLQRGNALTSPTVKAPGSDTFQNFMTGRRLGWLGNFIGHVPLVGKALRGVGDHIDQRVNTELANAMLDPSYASSLLRRGIVPMSLSSRIAKTLGRGAVPATIGPVASFPPPLRMPLPTLPASRIQARGRHVPPWLAAAVHVKTGPGRHATILPPSYPGRSPQVIPGLIGMAP